MPNAEDARAVWVEMLAQPERTVFVAEVDGRVCATADLLLVANLTRNARPWSIVENVVVDEAARRQGVGRALMTEVLAAAAAAGAYKVQLISAPDREAHAFYETLGFDVRADGFRKYFF